MRNYFFILIIIVLLGACGKNNERDNLTPNSTIPSSEIDNLNDSIVRSENMADKNSLVLGIWEEGENETGLNLFFFYFTADKVLHGIFQSGYSGVFNWSIADDYIHLDGKIADHEEIRTVSSYLPFAIIDYNTIKINERVFIRISEQDLLPHYTSKDYMDELIESF